MRLACSEFCKRKSNVGNSECFVEVGVLDILPRRGIVISVHYSSSSFKLARLRSLCMAPLGEIQMHCCSRYQARFHCEY